MNKFCNRCKEVKNTSQFYKRADGIKGFRHECKPCRNRINPDTLQKAGPKVRLSVEQRKENSRLACKKWNKNNTEKANHNTNMRRARKISATPKWLTEVQKDHIYCIYETAKVLEKEFGVKFHVDHIVPLKGKNVCGMHVPWNLQVMSASANLSKGNRLENNS